MSKRWWIGGATAAVAVAVAAAVAVGGKDKLGGAQAGKGKDAKPQVTLEFSASEVVAPQMATMPGLVEFSGPLVAPGTAVVRAKAGGTLLALSVAEGMRVRAGQSLGSVDLADLHSRIAERLAMIESARATLAQAERNLAQNERLAAQGFISSAALDSSRAAVDTARAQLRAAEAQLGTTRVALRDTALVAPIGGIVAKRHVVAGEKLQAEQPVLTIVDLATLELAGTVGTHEVSRLSPGMAATIQVEGVADPVSGRIARIAPAAEPGTRSIGVTIGLDNEGERLRAGQYAVARVTLADDTPRLTLPAHAVGAGGGQHHVWVIDSGTLQRRAVTLGRRDERRGRVEVLDGVTLAATVLAARFDNLREGAKAAVVAAKAAPVASASAPAAR
jgi:RND family efflux transporter MFP subunit